MKSKTAFLIISIVSAYLVFGIVFGLVSSLRTDAAQSSTATPEPSPTPITYCYTGPDGFVLVPISEWQQSQGTTVPPTRIPPSTKTPTPTNLPESTLTPTLVPCPFTGTVLTGLNIRAKADANSAITGSLASGSVVDILEVSGTWVHLCKGGWANSQLQNGTVTIKVTRK